MTTTKTPEQVVAELQDRGVRRVKIGLTDIDGVMRGKYIGVEKFASLASKTAGFCDCVFGWDVNDQLYDNSAFSCWDKGFPDIQFRVDFDTLRTLPYEENTPFFLADFVPPEGAEYHPVCPRGLLRRVLKQADEMGFHVHLGFEYEFFLFDESSQSIREKGYRDLDSFTLGNFGYSVLRSSVHSDLHQAFLDYCEALDLPLEGYHTETGPGVMEAALAVSPAIEAADRAALFKTFAKVFFQKQGLVPTFMAKWSPNYPGQSGHLHMSMTDNSSGEPVFHDTSGRSGMSATMESFVAGQVAHMREMCAMVAPTINSYTRLVKGAWAPTAAAWDIDNRTTAVRAITGSPKSQRVEYRLGAADGNPYLVAAAALASGLQGIRAGLKVGDPVRGNAYDVQDSLPPERQLPSTLRQAGELFSASEISRQAFGNEFVEHYAATRLWEARQFERAITDWELARYFEII